MTNLTNRRQSYLNVISRTERVVPGIGEQKVSKFYGENTFNIFQSDLIPEATKRKIEESVKSNKTVDREVFDDIAKIVTDWAVERGATHFCHWFQPLTGTTAEKHDAFLDFEASQPIERLSSSALIQGEPDASSFPHGGSRSTFEARGYTTWDLTSPLFLMSGVNGKTLCIPTAFVSYHGNALDIKTPLLRSTSRLNEVATKFLHLCGDTDSREVKVTCGLEQEYFLVDKSFYYLRPDLPMTGRTLFGSLPAKNQQLSDHYFGQIPERVESFMQELEHELYRLGIPAKTRHNEVAPGQFEMAPVFEDANVASDHGQIIMAMIKKIANKHQFVALLHEKPFATINGSGKHLNWSMASDRGSNLLNPGDRPQENARFLAVVAIVMEAVYRHSDALRMSIGSVGNDHRLGANEAPPSVISIFLGDTVNEIFESLKAGKVFKDSSDDDFDLGATQLAHLSIDNTDRNRTSPFAFTGNKFEFRAVGSSANAGFPLTILNGAVAEVFDEANQWLESELQGGKKIGAALMELAKKYAQSSEKVVFNGDGYSEEWLQEAERRGLPNMKTTADALEVLRTPARTQFLVQQKIFNPTELETHHNVLLERYCLMREIEFDTLHSMVNQYILPACLKYKKELADLMDAQEEVKIKSHVEGHLLEKISELTDKMYQASLNLEQGLHALNGNSQEERSFKIARELFPLAEKVAEFSNQLEDLIPDNYWDLPKYYDMLYVR